MQFTLTITTRNSIDFNKTVIMSLSNFSFAAVFDCPFIWSSSMEPHSLILSLIDETPNPAYSPEHISDSQPPFNFFQRTKELMILLAIKTNKLYVDYFYNFSISRFIFILQVCMVKEYTDRHR